MVSVSNANEALIITISGVSGIAGAHLGGRRRRPPLPFLENKKKCPEFGKRGPDCVRLWVKFPVQNAVLRVSRRKIQKFSLWGVLFLCF